MLRLESAYHRKADLQILNFNRISFKYAAKCNIHNFSARGTFALEE